MERKLTLGMLSALLPQNEKENEGDLEPGNPVFPVWESTRSSACTPGPSNQRVLVDAQHLINVQNALLPLQI